MIIFGIPFKKKNEKVFQDNYEKYFPVVYKQLYYLTGNNRLAEDLTQEVFIKYYHSEIEAIEHMGAWFSKVATNTAYNYLRGEKRRLNREESIIEETSEIYTVEDSIMRNEEVLKVHRALFQLADQQRICLVMKFSGYSYDEIHQATGIPKNNISQLVSRGKQKFIGLFKEEGDSNVLYKRSSPAGLGECLRR